MFSIVSCVCIILYIFAHTHTQTYIFMYKPQKFIYVYICICTHTHTHTHTQIFFQAAVVSILLYGCTTWTLNKRLEKKLDSNYTRMLRAILNKSWRQHPTKHRAARHDDDDDIYIIFQSHRMNWFLWHSFLTTRHINHCLWQSLPTTPSIHIELWWVSPCWSVNICAGNLWRTSLMSSSLILQQSTVCFICLIWMVCEMGERWTYSCYFVGWSIQYFYKTDIHLSLGSTYASYTNFISYLSSWHD